VVCDLVPVQNMLRHDTEGHVGYASDAPVGGVCPPRYQAFAPVGRSYRFKRTFDIVFSLIALFLLAPAFGLIACLIRLSSLGPVLFSQLRYGKDRRLFRIYKFRTMRCETESSDVTVQAGRGDSRVTPLGAFLRRTSLDELPQFINVLKGDMSIVGPRPHAPRTLIGTEFYEGLVAEFDHRHSTAPGLTGLAQISGCRGPIPDASSAANRFKYDLIYLEEQSLWLDLKIILVTIKKEFLTGSSY
jgi:lipopolysaccharide/colanic/teichoic acid biosynthesis glycosyltransferase